MEATPELAFVLLRLAEDITCHVTAADGETVDPCADSFALDEVGCVLLSALRDWARDSPATAVLGIALSIIRFTVNAIPDAEHPDTADTLAAMRDERLVLAHAFHSTPDAHQQPHTVGVDALGSVGGAEVVCIGWTRCGGAGPRERRGLP
ncbi:hypothetical protein ACE1SV_73490 [Streptomyces sp. E-15]